MRRKRKRVGAKNDGNRKEEALRVIVTPMPGGVGPGEVDDLVMRDLEDSFPDVDFVWCPTEEDELAAVAGAEIYCGWPSPEVYSAAGALKWIHCPGTGIDGVLGNPELRNSDIPITNSRESHVSPMATHVFGFITALSQKLPEMWAQQSEGVWGSGDYGWRQIELEGAVLGIYGFGNIGRRVAKRAQGFDMRVLAVDKHPRPSPNAEAVWGLERLDELVSMSDWFVVSAPYTEETRGAIDRRRIGLMKSTAHVIVISRGGIVDETALCDAVREGELAGAGLDATEPEPPEPDSPLWGTPNIILSPHCSALTPDMYLGRREVFKDNLRRYLANQPLMNVCDKIVGY